MNIQSIEENFISESTKDDLKFYSSFALTALSIALPIFGVTMLFN